MKKRLKPGMWVGFGLVVGISIGLVLQPQAVLFFAALGVIISVLIASLLKR